MTTYKQILLAFDFSDETDFLIKRASEMAFLNNAKISLVHILDNIPMPDMSYGTIIALNDETDNALLEQQKNKCNEIGKFLNVPETQRWLIWGNPKTALFRPTRLTPVIVILLSFYPIDFVYSDPSYF